MNNEITEIIFSDAIRDKLLKKEKFKNLIKTYTQKQPSFIDENNEVFWKRKILSENNKDYLTQRRINLVFKEILRHRKLRVLDIGVGQAYLEKLFKTKDAKVSFFGIDIVDIKPKKLFSLGCAKVKNLNRLPLKERSFEAITILEVLEHIKPNNVFAVLRELHRILQNDGILIISVPINENLEKISSYDKKRQGFINPNSHLRVYNKNLIVWELEHCGFKIEKIFEIIAFPKNGNLLTFLNKFLCYWKPNDLVIVARKAI